MEIPTPGNWNRVISLKLKVDDDNDIDDYFPRQLFRR